MMSKFFIWLIVFSSPLTLLAYEVEIKGFIAADILNLEQIKQKKKETDRSFHSGISVLDLKLYGRFDKLRSKIKLDLDSGSLAQRYNLFEEATLSYKILPKLEIKMGKGLVPFHRKHWGVLKHSYRDSGSELNPEHSWRDQDKKILLSFRYGSYRSGLINSFTLWGNSSRPSYEDGKLKFIGREGSSTRRLSYDTNINFNTSEEQGFANRMEFFFDRTHSLSLAGIAYNSKWNPHWSYAVDTSYRYRTSKRELWFAYTYGILGTHWGAKYAVDKSKEHLVQLGMDQYLNSHFNIVANTEYAKVDRKNHSDELGNSRYNDDGLLHNVDTFKVETGIKLKFSGRSGHLTFGVFYEQKNKISGGIRQPKRSAMQLANTLAFWF